MQTLCHSLKICGQLPAAIVNGGEDSFWKWPDFQLSWPWPWIGSYYTPSCITHRPLPTCQISLKLKKLFVDRQTDGHLRPALLGRPCQKVDPNITHWPHRFFSHHQTLEESALVHLLLNTTLHIITAMTIHQHNCNNNVTDDDADYLDDTFHTELLRQPIAHPVHTNDMQCSAPY